MKKTPVKKESRRVEIFLREYMKDLNATAAAIRAGFSQKTARNIAGNLLAKINIQERLKILMEQRQKRLDVDADKVLQRFCDFAFATPQELMEQWGDTGIGIKVSDVIKALENVSKHIVDVGTPAKIEKGRELLTKLKAKEIEVRDAAIEFAILGLPLPDVIRIELQKQKEPDVPIQAWKVISDEELDRNTADAMAKALAWQENKLPERRANVARLEHELTGNNPKLKGEGENQ